VGLNLGLFTLVFVQTKNFGFDKLGPLDLALLLTFVGYLIVLVDFHLILILFN